MNSISDINLSPFASPSDYRFTQRTVSTCTLFSCESQRIRKRKPYHYVNSGLRRYLLYLVKDQNYSIKDAAQALKLNYSTAKTIIQVFRKTGRIDKVDKNHEISI